MKLILLNMNKRPIIIQEWDIPKVHNNQNEAYM